MKKLLIAVAAGLIIFGGQAKAAPVDDLNAQIETQEVGKWAHFRDKYILDRETENERRDRKEWERRHRYDPPPHHYRDGHRRDYYPPPSPPPPRYRDGHRGYPPPPPPRHGDGHRGYPPPPPPRYR
ncbi:MAG: hypothetical protein IKN16_00790 [Selenomonadaceae bacterium]|nr:hypothetical protein [Selenomonadaceae bacterium]